MKWATELRRSAERELGMSHEKTLVTWKNWVAVFSILVL